MRLFESSSARWTGVLAIATAVAACGGGGEQKTAASAGGSPTDTSAGFVQESPTSNENPAVTATKVTHKFTGDVQVANAGRTLFLQYNCYGCHGGLAGGAMGPSLRDTVWKFGGSDQGIFASIHDGRPAGMPAWGKTSSNVGQQGKTLSDDQIRTIITYIHSLRTEAEPTFFFWDQRDSSAARGTA